MRVTAGELVALAVSVALHGGTSWAAYGGSRPTGSATRLVGIDGLELAPAVAAVPASPKPAAEPDPTIIKPHHEPAQVTSSPKLPPPTPPPPAVAMQASEISPQGTLAVPIGDPAVTDPKPQGEVHGVDGGAPGGAPGGESGGVKGGVVNGGGAQLPIVGPSYAAAYLNNTPPRYPAMARRMRLQGTAMIRVLVDTDGHPEHVRLERTSGVGVLDEAALEAVQHWTFVPARQGTAPIHAEVDVPLSFRLEAMAAE
jgi:protein TonB